MTDNPVLTAAENKLLQDAGLNPADYGAISGQAQVDPQRPMGLGPVATPNGIVECIVIPLVLILPTSVLRPASRLMDSSGAPRSPVEGMLPVLNTRALVPLARLAERRPMLVIPNGDFPQDVE